jgi:D-3-phosphoglycerate dehydrogenase / 2-oxoglutarate reductase
MTHILIAGDRFVTPDVFRTALDAALPAGAEYAEWELPWPHEPFGSVGGVDEASGTPAEVIEQLGAAEVAVTQLAPFTAEVFSARPDLRMVGVCRGGPVNVDLAAATRAGVVVTFAPGRNAQAAAEYAVALMLAASRRIASADRELRRGVWRGDYYALDEVGTELGAATVGLVGYGAIGRIVARILLAFGAEVIAADPYADPESLAADGVRAVTLDELLAAADVVSLHARLTPETRHLIDADALARLKPGAVLVNSARGGLLDYAPLPGLLADGRLGALALDVYDIEPPPADWPLFAAENVVLSPHLAGASRQTAERAAAIVAADVARVLAGGTALHVANPEVLS